MLDAVLRPWDSFEPWQDTSTMIIYPVMKKLSTEAKTCLCFYGEQVAGSGYKLSFAYLRLDH
jgi:hypothetical protein